MNVKTYSRREALLLLAGGATAVAGCGSGRKTERDTTDYLDRVLPARWIKPGIAFRVVGGPVGIAAAVRRSIRDSIFQWREPLTGLLSITETKDEEPADVSVHFVTAGSLGGDFLGNQTLGITNVTVDNSRRPGVVLAANMRLDSQLWVRFVTLDKIAPHEFGHCLGIQGHSPKGSDLMASPPARKSLSARDENTVNRMYLLPVSRIQTAPNIVTYQSVISENPKTGELFAESRAIFIL